MLIAKHILTAKHRLSQKREYMKIPKHRREDIRLAKKIWGDLSRPLLQSLEVVLRCHRLSVIRGDLLLIDHRWYVTHTGLLGLALRNRCAGIDAKLVTELCDPKSRRWTFCATVYKSKTCRG